MPLSCRMEPVPVAPPADTVIVAAFQTSDGMAVLGVSFTKAKFCVSCVDMPRVTLLSVMR